MTPENEPDDARTLRDLQGDFPHLDISIEFLFHLPRLVRAGP
jgi:hypothetical protein